MARCIDADKLVAELQKKPIHDGHFIHTRDVSDAIFYAPTISPDEVRGVGHWVTEQEAIDAGDYSLRDTCSVCGRCDWDCTESDSFKYCPNCGAKMLPEPPKGVE